MNPRMCVVVILIVLHYGTWNRHGSLVGYGQLTLWPCFRKCSSGQVVFDFFLGLYSVAECIKKRALERFLAAWWLVVPKGLKKKSGEENNVSSQWKEVCFIAVHWDTIVNLEPALRSLCSNGGYGPRSWIACPSRQMTLRSETKMPLKPGSISSGQISKSSHD